MFDWLLSWVSKLFSMKTVTRGLTVVVCVCVVAITYVSTAGIEGKLAGGAVFGMILIACLLVCAIWSIRYLEIRSRQREEQD